MLWWHLGNEGAANAGGLKADRPSARLAGGRAGGWRDPRGGRSQDGCRTHLQIPPLPAGSRRGAPPALHSAHPTLSFPFTTFKSRTWPRHLLALAQTWLHVPLHQLHRLSPSLQPITPAPLPPSPLPHLRHPTPLPWLHPNPHPSPIAPTH